MIQRPLNMASRGHPHPSQTSQVKLRGGGVPGVPGVPGAPLVMPRAPDFDEPNSLLPSELLGPDRPDYAGPNSSLPWSDSRFPATRGFRTCRDFHFFKYMVWLIFGYIWCILVDIWC